MFVFQVRKYRREDFEEAYRLDLECFEPGIAYSRPELRYYLQHPHSLTLVGESASPQTTGILGFTLAKREHAGNAHLITIDIAERARGRGLGSLLLQTIQKEMSALDCRALMLEVAVNNVPALRFYGRHGFSVQRTIPRYYLNSIDALQMSKPLERLTG